MPLERDLVVRYTTSAFVDAGSLQNDVGLVGALSEQLRALELSPLPVGPAGSLRTPELPFAAFSSIDGGEQLVLSATRFDLNYLGRSPRSPATPTRLYQVRRSAEVINLILAATGRSSHRLTVITDEVATKAANAGLDTDIVARKLLALPQGAAQLFDWVHKFGVRVTRNDLRINVITEMSYIRALSATDSFEGLHFVFDVNTTPEESRGRFIGDTLVAALETLFQESEEAAQTADTLVGDTT